MDKPYIGIAHVPYVIKLVEKKLGWNGFVVLVAEALEDGLKHVPDVMDKGGLTNELYYTLTLMGVSILLNTLQLVVRIFSFLQINLLFEHLSINY